LFSHHYLISPYSIFVVGGKTKRSDVNRYFIFEIELSIPVATEVPNIE